MSRRLMIGALGGLVAALSTWMYAPDAAACGGTFCDAGPTQMPVDQTGENILFAIEDGFVEAHVQIQYEGDPEQFAWIVPVVAEPEISAGSEALFDAIMQATVPTFVLNSRFEGCDDQRGPGFGCAAKEDARFAGTDLGAEGDGGGMGTADDPDVVDRGVAGAFEYAVLSGGTVDGVVTWLTDNGYAQDDEAPEILEQYLAEDFLFVAFKLRGGTDVSEIHPVVIRYEGNEPCVPIRLTRIAALDDMGIRVFFLGEHRMVPTNYKNVLINPLLIDWNALGTNYSELITRAVDHEGSDGHGFVTEYAGPSNVVAADQFVGPDWDADRLVGIAPIDVVDELEAQGLMSCNDGSCSYAHPLVEGLLQRYLPRPTGVTADEFYDCLSCYEDMIDLDAWSDTGFAMDMQDRIIAPAQHAATLLNAHPYLTRMYMTMSPHEMTKDPLFHANADLPEVSNTITATRVTTCEGPDYIELEDGRRIALDSDGMLPEDMPWAEGVEEVPPQGAPMMVNDNLDEIDAALARWNEDHGLDDGDGCNCRASDPRLAGATWMLFVFGWAWGASRRRRC